MLTLRLTLAVRRITYVSCFRGAAVPCGGWSLGRVAGGFEDSEPEGSASRGERASGPSRWRAARVSGLENTVGRGIRGPSGLVGVRSAVPVVGSVGLGRGFQLTCAD